MGNLRSVEKALERVGAEVRITADADLAAGSDGLVLPGVGAFPKAMERVRELGFDRLVREHVEAGAPLLGICLGLQLLFESSTEHGGAEGIGLLEGEVTVLDAAGLKVPHMGWEPVRWEADSPLTDGLAGEPSFYFVHSYAVRPAEPADILGTAVWGERFAAVVARPPVYGAQCHPEKSSADGLRLLGNFASLCRAPTPA
jgi:glutamine amidotransferase